MEEAPNRKFFVKFLEMCQKGQPVLVVDGEEQVNPPMTKEEADLRLAIFDGDIPMSEEVNLQLLQFEALRFPHAKKTTARMWKAMDDLDKAS